MNTAFSHALRVLICPDCGAAVHLPAHGGEARCEVCQQVVTAGPRRDQVGSDELTRLVESERLARLRAQDGSARPLPAALGRLVQHGALREEMAAEAMGEWQLSRAALGAGAVGAEERFYRLTLLLARHLGGRGDDLRLRALLETAYEVLPGPSHRQVVRAGLALRAAAAGDRVAAGDWLDGCDRHSAQLAADGAYRAAAGCLAVALHNPARVLDFVGARAGDVPVDAGHDAILSVLRADAYERLGDQALARDEIAEAARRIDGGQRAIVAVVREHARLNLCSRRYPAARQLSAANGSGSGGVASRSAPRRAGAAGPSRSGALWFAASMAALMAAVAVGPDRTVGPGRRLDELLLVLAIALALPVLLPAARRLAHRRLARRRGRC